MTPGSKATGGVVSLALASNATPAAACAVSSGASSDRRIVEIDCAVLKRTCPRSSFSAVAIGATVAAAPSGDVGRVDMRGAGHVFRHCEADADAVSALAALRAGTAIPSAASQDGRTGDRQHPAV